MMHVYDYPCLYPNQLSNNLVPLFFCTSPWMAKMMGVAPLFHSEPQKYISPNKIAIIYLHLLLID